MNYYDEILLLVGSLIIAVGVLLSAAFNMFFGELIFPGAIIVAVAIFRLVKGDLKKSSAEYARTRTLSTSPKSISENQETRVVPNINQTGKFSSSAILKDGVLSQIRCGNCGTINDLDAVYCKKCAIQLH